MICHSERSEKSPAIHWSGEINALEGFSVPGPLCSRLFMRVLGALDASVSLLYEILTYI